MAANAPADAAAALPAHDFLLMYATVLGNAEEIAKTVHVQAHEHGLSPLLLDVADYESVDLAKESTLVMVTSTTGEGDLPDSALKFARQVKKMGKLFRKGLSHMHYTVLGLGDTNYDNFCNGGKTLDKLLSKAGAQCFYARGDADDEVGLEEVVEPWVAGLWPVLNDLRNRKGIRNELLFPGLAAKESHGTLLGGAPTPTGSDDGTTESDSTAHGEGVGATKKKKKEKKRRPAGARLLPCLIDVNSVDIGSCPVRFPDTPEEELYWFASNCRLPTGGELLRGRVEGVRRLSADVERVKHITEVTVRCDALGELPWAPGDDMRVVCRNPEDDVQRLLTRINACGEGIIEVVPRAGEGVTSTTVAHIPTIIKTRHVFMYGVDMRATPKKTFVRMLAEFASNATERAELMHMTTPKGRKEYMEYFVESRPTLLDILERYPSVDPPLDYLIYLLPPLQPRSYSVTTSPLRDATSFSAALTVVDYETACGARRGICSHFLPRAGEVVFQWHASTHMKLPADPQTPVVMIGPGTGMAPFRSFCEQRALEGTAHGEMWMFVGCRYADDDYLYKDEWEAWAEAGLLTHLVTAFSREQADKVYVWHRMRDYADQLCALILQHNAHVYVCGDGFAMGGDVHRTLGEILTAGGVDGPEVLRQRAEVGAYVRDVWSS